ncbi:MAG: hypothetical protein IK020_08850 [Clostridiales bacterium]|nr:hypothetical protein [Clostridiales bacterium]
MRTDIELKKSMSEKEKVVRLVFVLTIVCSLIVIVRGFFSGKPLNDYFWHYKVGEWIVKNKEVPTFGIYSWFAKDNGLYWFSHEWLSGVVIYLTSFGSMTAAMVSAMIIQIAIMLLMTISTRKYAEKNALVYGAWHIAAVIVMNKYFYPRPHIYSYFLLFFEMAILYKFKKEEKNTKLVYFLPLIAVLWANFHGGSSNLIYIIPVLVLLTSLCDFTIGRVEFTRLPKEKLKSLGLATMLSVIGLCVNPHGYKLLTYPLDNMNDKLMLSAISEWAAPDIKNISSFKAIIPVIIIALVFFLTKKKINAMDLLIFAFFTYLYLRSERFVALLLISACFYMFDYVIDLDLDAFLKCRPLIKKAVYALAVVGVLSFAILTAEQALLSDGSVVTDHAVSDEAIAVIRSRNPRRMYNHYNLGGELIYNDLDVFIDGRADMYSKYNFRDFMDMTSMTLDGQGKWHIEEMLAKYNFDLFVCTQTDKTRVYLEAHPDEYECIYEDAKVIIFAPC